MVDLKEGDEKRSEEGESYEDGESNNNVPFPKGLPKVLAFGTKKIGNVKHFVYDSHLPEEETPVEYIMRKRVAIDVLGWLYIFREEIEFRENPNDEPLRLLVYDHESKFWDDPFIPEQNEESRPHP